MAIFFNNPIDPTCHATVAVTTYFLVVFSLHSATACQVPVLQASCWEVAFRLSPLGVAALYRAQSSGLQGH